MHKPEDVIKQILDSKASKVKVAITDLDGVLRGKIMQVDKFLSAVESGFGFCSVVFGWDSADQAYDHVDYTGWHTGYPDAKVNLDLSTFRRVPWDQQVPFFLGDFVDDQDRPLAICPRQLLKKVLARAEVGGMFAKVGVEFEWFNFRETPLTLSQKSHLHPEPLTPGMFGYSLLRSGFEREYFNALYDEMREFHVPIEGLHTETGPGVYEVAIAATDALEAADRAVLFKSGAKEIANRFGFTASFMARWNNQLQGCSGHIHQSLRNTEGTPLFYDAADPLKMSQIFKSYLAGVMHCLPDILPMFAPTINSYKRLVEGFWAPTRVTWGRDNRTVCCRVIPGSEKSTRLELRVGGADINPYLAVAATLAAGLYGIEHKLQLTTPITQGSGYANRDAKLLSRNLDEATTVFRQSALARELFGDAFVEHYAATRAWEWREFQKSVTDWELKRYFEII
ncbi:MAG: glutamine synthetase family protein [Proteobacteria bacterium]|nr:glutamine synthetase family protein [Pseudomonadota bacterium]